MKLSKKDLRCALQGEEQALANDGLFPNRFGNSVQALNEGDLEIEGYVRKDHLRDTTKMVDEWTKFDPDDPKTFPPCNYEWFLIAAQKSLEPPTFTVMPECATEALLAEIRNDIIKFKLNVYWRPLPKPPTEQEGGSKNSDPIKK
jgi:hypothetical protein